MNLYADYRKNQLQPPLISNWCRPYGWYLRGWLPPDLGAEILEIGCGEGNLLAAFREWGYSAAQGVDFRTEAVLACRVRGLTAEAADVVEFLQKSPLSWDIVIGIDVLEHLDYNRALVLLRALRAALKPGGAAIFQTPNMGSPFGGHVQFGDLTHQMVFTPDSLAQLLKMAGFDKVDLRSAGPGPWSVLSACRFVAWQCCATLLRGWNFIETGSSGSRILTRVMLCRAINQ